MTKKKTPAKKAPAKKKPPHPDIVRRLFVGGSRDATWHEAPENIDSVRIIPRQRIDEQLLNGPDDETPPVYRTETYTLRDISFEGGDLNVFALDELEDVDVGRMLIEFYAGQNQVKCIGVDLPAVEFTGSEPEIPTDREPAGDVPAFLRRQAD